LTTCYSKSSILKHKKAWIVEELSKRSLSTDGYKHELAERLSLAVKSEQAKDARLSELVPEKEALLKLLKTELQAELRARGLPVSGTKPVLAERLLTAMKAAAAPANPLAAVGEAERLELRLGEVDRSVASLAQKLEEVVQSRESVGANASELMRELRGMQSEWEADRASLLEIEQLAAVLEAQEELAPEVTRRKDALIRRLRVLRKEIAEKEERTVALRRKLRLVQQARMVGVANAVVEEELEEELEPALLVAASGGSVSTVERPPVPARPAASPEPAAPARRPAGIPVSEPQDTAVAGGGGGSGGAPMGRVQTVSTRTFVAPPPPPPATAPAVPAKPDAGSGPEESSGDSLRAPTGVPSASEEQPLPSGTVARWPKLREPASVGIALTLVAITVFSGIRAALSK